ncbi:MAG: GNAT family N-acetyltransferase [Alteromonadaceae bacterium]|jgi:CelD/BcsL family acetyltransferase involved in cellulose biosynthesis|nr:GNAT family N-acetyltransferase [Alteromonadaceae bacterium]
MSVFQTKAWQSAWWDTWGQQSGFRLIRSWDGEVSGLYESRYRFKGFLPIRSLQFVGTSSRELRTPRTEHNRLFNKGQGLSLQTSFEQLLKQSSWTEAVFSDLPVNSFELSALETIAANNNWSIRTMALDDGYAVSTVGRFSDYLSSIGSNSRLRLYNRRKVLETIGQVREENLWPDDQERFFAALNEFHRARWSRNCFGETSLAFHKRFLSQVVEEGGKPQLLALSCNQQLVSVMYNVWYRGVLYNIQAGFDEDFHKKLSLGSLHLGYVIEEAFSRNDTHQFDMLVGQGKKEDYKARFATEAYQLKSVMLVKSPMFRVLYWIKG